MATASTELRSSRDERIGPIILVSIVFHIVMLAGLPMATKLFRKTEKFERPRTFKLVTMPAPRPARTLAPTQVASAKPPTSKAAPKTKTASASSRPRPAPPQKQEDLSELAEALGGLPTPAATLNFDADIQDYYKLAMLNKIEKNWKPAVSDPGLSVVVAFTIFVNGEISAIEITRSSGSASLDKTALRAIKIASPFGKIPHSYKSNRIDIQCTLRPVRR